MNDRDRFAAHAMTALIQQSILNVETPPGNIRKAQIENIAIYSYVVADAMMKERAKTPTL